MSQLRNKKQYVGDFILSNRIVGSSNTKLMDPAFKSALFEDILQQQSEKVSWFDTFRISFSKPQLLGISLGILIIIGSLIATGFLIFRVPDSDDNPDNTTSSPPSITASISDIEGTVQVSSDGSTWVDVDNSTSIKQEDRIRTQTNARTEITFDDGSIVRLDEDTVANVVTLGENEIILENQNGNLYARVSEANQRFEVVSDNIRYVATGTAFEVVNGEKEFGINVFESSVNAVLEDDGKALVEEGERFFNYTGGPDVDLGFKTEKISRSAIREDRFIIWCIKKDKEHEEYKEKLGFLEDLEPPLLEITSPVDGFSTSEQIMLVAGTTEAGAIVKVNEEEIENKDGTFSTEITLQEGENDIVIIAIDTVGNFVEKTINGTFTRPVIPSITLSAYATANGIQLNWTIANLSAPEGFKIVASAGPNPVYPDNYYEWVSGDTFSHFIPETDGQGYHFRICRFSYSFGGDQGGCDIYSNDVYVIAPKKN